MMKEAKTIYECFEILLSKRCWYKNSGIERRVAANDKTAFKKGTLSDWKIKKYLEAAGWQQYQPELWILK